MKKITPLLLTGNINPHQQSILKLYDKDVRYRQYIDNIINLITMSDFTHFVFCENSLTGVQDEKMLHQLGNYYKKSIEFITFQGDEEKTKQLTRAYGDQEIMEYAIDNSSILHDAGGFYKLTGRYHIKNINKVIKNRYHLDTVFIRGGFYKNTVHTCFFKVTKEYFTEHFYGKGEQLPRFNNSLEKLYYRYIKQSGINMSIHHTHPIFSGEWGSGGIMDESRIMQQKTKLFAQLGVYDIHTTPEFTNKNN